ncbi:7TM diverse intracellular signaling domain-containing protein [Oligoflexus tunisiensis]|uniref:7TM diverse intracellular signaling domain-containing protein n=1 Tax=Oligoflexus tunisiensis TaxID=708132 RepID=UPI001C4073EB|nr:7TM diverse intracellular signaling domain-containing protein [Oligoflexus tunisiensis]
MEVHLQREGAGDLSQGTAAQYAEWADTTRDIPSFGFDDSGTTAYWVRFRVENPQGKPIEIFLASHYPATDLLRLYEGREDGKLTFLEEQGDQVSYRNRSVHARIPAFRIMLAPGMHTFYLEQKSLGAVQFALKIWRPDAFREFAGDESLILGAILGSCVFIFCYNFFIFVRFRSRVYFLYVLYNLTVCIYLCNFLGFTQMKLLPDATGSWWMGEGAKINMDLLQISGLAFAIAFLALKQHAPRWRRYLLFLIFLGVLTLLNTITAKLWFNKQTAIFSMVVSVSLLASGFYLSKRLTYARYYTLGWSFLLILNLATMLSLMGITATDITLISWGQSLGFCLELCLLSFALGERIATINRQKEETLRELHQTKNNLFLAEQEQVHIQSRLLAERERHIEELDLKVEERTRELRSLLNNLHQGIFAIRFEEQICLMGADYSPHLHEIFGAFDSLTVDPIQLIFQHSLLGHDDQSRIRSTIVSMIDSDRISFELNTGSLPREIDLALPSGIQKTLEIDWDPIVDSHGCIREILVAVRDVTEFKVLRNQLLQQSEDVAIAKDLLGDDRPLQGARIAKIAHELQDLLKLNGQDEKKHVAVLGRLHSLKGDARTLNLNALSEAIHEAESCLIQTNEEERTRGMARAASLAERYQEVWAILENRFRKVKDCGLQPCSSPELSLQEILAAEIAEVGRLAQELGKVTPRISVDSTPLKLPQGVGDALRESFAHMLRNSLDHGLESPEERRQLGKSTYGTIIIRVQEAADHYEISYRDDGRGLDLMKLRSKAREQGIMDIPEGDDAAAANLIFVPELSTRDAVSLVSGRGIGMDAVRSRIEGLGGSIEIDLPADKSATSFRSFTLRIRLPKSTASHGLHEPRDMRAKLA